jgi:uncharacterized protein (TIGR00369 family)
MNSSRSTRFPGSRYLRTPQPQGFGLMFNVLDDGRVHARIIFDDSKEGPPGYVHGGALAVVLDEAMGTACYEAGRLGFTATMTVNFRVGAALDTEFEVWGQVDGVEGRRTQASARITTHDGAVVADAQATFVMSERLHQLLADHDGES